MRYIILAAILAAILLCGCLESGTSGYQSPPANDTATKDAIAQMKILVDAGKGIEYTASYRMLYYFAGANSSAVETYYIKGENARVDFVSGDGNTTLFKLGNSSYSCTGPLSNSTCVLLSSNTSSSPDIADELGANIDLYEVAETDSRTVSGIRARCFAVMMKMDSGTAALLSGTESLSFEYCFSSDGIPVFVSSPMSTLALVSLNRSVPGGVFALPAEPVALSVMGTDG